MDVVFEINNQDYHNILSTYNVVAEVGYVRVITFLDGTKRPIPQTIKRAVEFSLFPMTEEESTLLYNQLSQFTVTCKFTDPNTGLTLSKSMYVDSNISHAFALLSVDGKRRYTGEAITLREE